jgi:hypothetical protein
MSEQVDHQRTLGNPRLVATMQALVDEPLDAVVAIRHRGFLWLLGVVVLVAVGVLSLSPLGNAGALVFALSVGLLVAVGSYAVGALLDARSPVRLRAPGGVLGVSGSTVYVARGAFWNGSAATLTMTFSREPSTIVLGGTGWGYRALTVTPPQNDPVRLEATFPISSRVMRDAISALGRPPEAEWRPDPGRPDQLRWWDGGEFSSITTRRPDPSLQSGL